MVEVFSFGPMDLEIRNFVKLQIPTENYVFLG